MLKINPFVKLRANKEELEGAAFGLTSGTITTLGVLIGVFFATESKFATIAAILIVAIADAVSDALGIYSAKETEKGVSQRAIWRVTQASFWAKFLVSAVFIIPVIFLSQLPAIVISQIAGFGLLFFLGVFVAKVRAKPPFVSAVEYVIVGLIVVFVTFLLGRFLGRLR